MKKKKLLLRLSGLVVALCLVAATVFAGEPAVPDGYEGIPEPLSIGPIKPWG